MNYTRRQLNELLIILFLTKESIYDHKQSNSIRAEYTAG